MHDSCTASGPYRVRLAVLGLLGLAAACDPGTGDGPELGPGGNAQLLRIEFGRLADVYGRAASGSGALELVERDVLIGADITDDMPVPGISRLGNPVRYRFLAPDAESLQLRVLIGAAAGSRDFERGRDALDDTVRRLVPARFGGGSHVPFSLVPRNAALRLVFSRPLGIDQDFFVERDASGAITGVKNTEAVQLLAIAADPEDPPPGGAFVPIATRIVPRGDTIVLDPVLLGEEGPRWGHRNNPTGLPESPDPTGANIRIAVALEGPLRIVGVREHPVAPITGIDNAGRRAVVRDFRSGNRDDTNPEVSRGFVRATQPPRLVGRLPFVLERITRRDPDTLTVRVYKRGIVHEIDAGDALRFVPLDPNATPVTVDVLQEPSDDLGQPDVQHVDVVVGDDPALLALDPSRLPGYPTAEAEREAWLPGRAAAAVLVCGFEGSREHPTEPGRVLRDHPELFVRFTPAPQPAVPGNQNLSPHVSAVVEFSRPVDLDSVRAHDTLFFATRDLLDDDQVQAFRRGEGPLRGGDEIPPPSFSCDKFATPHLVGSRVLDDSGSQTTLQLRPLLGLYLDDAMRDADGNTPFAQQRFRYFLHLVAGNLSAPGVTDLSGLALDLGYHEPPRGLLREATVVPLALDLRRNPSGAPLQPDNRVVYCVRRHGDRDEDERPSYYLATEAPVAGVSRRESVGVDDLFGAVTYLADGRLAGRSSARTSRWIDDQNQAPPPPPACPPGEIATRTAGTPFSAPLQNPLNPFGARLQTVWREVDMNLACDNPDDFNLDVEQLWWAPFQQLPVLFDVFDRLSLFLGHAEYRPDNCVGGLLVTPTFGASGLRQAFADNPLRNTGLDLGIESQPARTTAFADQSLLINSSLSVTDPSGAVRYLPLPEFQEPYFVWRDETVMEQGGNSFRGSDTTSPLYLCSPFLGGVGWGSAAATGGGFTRVTGRWNNYANVGLGGRRREQVTGGLLGAIALPLLADFWVYPDDPDLPASFGFTASGANGWQVSLPVTSGFRPNFRAYSAGTANGGTSVVIDPATPQWQQASGGFDLSGAPTRWGDNTFYWLRADFLKRTSVATSGFVDLLNPHRMPAAVVDPRLGPYPAGRAPNMTFAIEPPNSRQPAGTTLRAELRAAGPVDPAPWHATVREVTPPDAGNFDLDPRKAGDAHIRKFDDRGQRNHWTHYYNRNVTAYTDDPNTLFTRAFLDQFKAPAERFGPDDVRYVNWRLVLRGNVDATPPVTPRIDTTVLAYRLR